MGSMNYFESCEFAERKEREREREGKSWKKRLGWGSLFVL